MAHHQPIRKHPQAPRTSAFVSATTGDIPDKLYFRIGEVARLCDVPAYVLRFWESEFPQLKPNKGGTGQRLFRRRDVEMALRIKCLLYDEGYTIPGARQLLKTEARLKEPQLLLLGEETLRPSDRDSQLRRLRQDLSGLLSLLQAAPGTASAPPAAPLGGLPSKRQPDSIAPPRRMSLSSVPANEKLFDFPGGASLPIDRQPALEDPDAE